QLDAGSARDLLVAARPFRSGAVLKPFLEAYRIVADAVAIFPPDTAVDQAELLEASIALGKQYEAQRKIQSVESVSTVLFDSAIKLAANRGILEASATRSEFAADITAIVSHLYALEALEAGLDAGITS
ncbi:MAG: hypothetical protein HKN07_06750, partial [Acidimicrobiia bacterium]|nr:hypothetical protein [Acidimicrobiia bacterium]